MIIDGHPVLAEFISEEADQKVIKKSEEWKSKRVRKLVLKKKSFTLNFTSHSNIHDIQGGDSE